MPIPALESDRKIDAVDSAQTLDPQQQSVEQKEVAVVDLTEIEERDGDAMQCNDRDSASERNDCDSDDDVATPRLKKVDQFLLNLRGV